MCHNRYNLWFLMAFFLNIIRSLWIAGRAGRQEQIIQKLMQRGTHFNSDSHFPIWAWWMCFANHRIKFNQSDKVGVRHVYCCLCIRLPTLSWLNKKQIPYDPSCHSQPDLSASSTNQTKDEKGLWILRGRKPFSITKLPTHLWKSLDTLWGNLLELGKELNVDANLGRIMPCNSIDPTWKSSFSIRLVTRWQWVTTCISYCAFNFISCDIIYWFSFFIKSLHRWK